MLAIAAQTRRSLNLFDSSATRPAFLLPIQNFISESGFQTWFRIAKVSAYICICLCMNFFNTCEYLCTGKLTSTWHACKYVRAFCSCMCICHHIFTVYRVYVLYISRMCIDMYMHTYVHMLSICQFNSMCRYSCGTSRGTCKCICTRICSVHVIVLQLRSTVYVSLCLSICLFGCLCICSCASACICVCACEWFCV